MTNIVIYARYSSDKQTEQSIEGQLRVCNEYAKKYGYNVVKEYIDRAMTGTNDHRPAFQQMLYESNCKQWQYVLVYKFDRFARSRHDSAVNKAILKKNGVKVISATELITDSPEGIILEGMLESFAEYYSAELSQKVKRGLKESVLKGNITGGVPLLGYRTENKKYLVDEEQAQIVRYIFQQYANGVRKVDIVKDLNARGYKTAINNKFTLNSLQNILKNKKYIGISKFGDIESTTTYPAIVDKKVFEKVQKMLITNKKNCGHAKAKVEYILTGKIFCGYCGAPMHGFSGTSKTGTKHNYYACNNRQKKHTCKMCNIKKEYIEDKVFQNVLDFVLQKENMETIANEYIKYFEKLPLDKSLKNCEKQIEECNKKIDNIIKIIASGTITTKSLLDGLDKQAKEQEIFKSDLMQEYRKLKLEQGVSRSKEDIIAFLTMYLKNKTTESDFEYKNRIIKLMINSVYVFGKDNMLINFSFIGDDPMTFEQMQKLLKENNVILPLSKGIIKKSSHIKPASPPIEKSWKRLFLFFLRQ